MRQVYVSEAAMAADAKAENVKVVVAAVPPYPDAVDSVHYYKAVDGTVYRQFAVIDGSHILLHGALIHVDDVQLMGTAGTIRMPKTGNVLSVPRPDIGETLAGYYLRTSKQTGGTPQRVNELLKAVDDKSNAPDAPVKKDAAGKVIPKFVPDRTGTPLIDWPMMVDWFANPVHYGPFATPPVGAGIVTPGGAAPVVTATAPAAVTVAVPAGTVPLKAQKGDTWINTATNEKWVYDGAIWRRA